MVMVTIIVIVIVIRARFKFLIFEIYLAAAVVATVRWSYESYELQMFQWFGTGMVKALKLRSITVSIINILSMCIYIYIYM